MALNPLLKKLVSQSASKYKGGNSKSVKLKDGRNVIRIIAPGVWQGEAEVEGVNPSFHRELGVHWIKPEKNGKPVAVVGSEEIVYNRVSTLSAMIEMAIAGAYDEDTKELYEEWKARKSILISVVNRDANDEVQTMELTPTTFGKIMELVALYDDSGIDVLNHAIGMDLVITKTGKGLNTQYDVAVVPLAPGKTFKPVTDEQVKQAEDLDKFIESNFFRGDDQKAISFVAQHAGIAIPKLGAPATPVAALTSAAATVADAPAPAVAAAPPAAAPATMTQEQMQAEIARQAALLAAQNAAPASAAVINAGPAVTAAQSPAVVTPETSMSDLGQDEQDALLAQLNSIGA